MTILELIAKRFNLIMNRCPCTNPNCGIDFDFDLPVYKSFFYHVNNEIHFVNIHRPVFIKGFSVSIFDPNLIKIIEQRITKYDI